LVCAVLTALITFRIYYKGQCVSICPPVVMYDDDSVLYG